MTCSLGKYDQRMPCWYWDKKERVHTPSHVEGLDSMTEARYRREGARFIFDVGTKLGLHYDTLATGIVYFHRFYMFHSFKQFPRYVTAACCLFLAGKVEETPKKCKDIIKTARSLLSDVQFAQFGEDPKEEVMVLERILLQTIKFDLQLEHPYQFLLKYAKQLKGDKNKLQRLVQMAWTFVNDSLCTTLCLQWEPEIIGVAVMYLAGRLCKFEIQEWTLRPNHRRWWEQFVQDVPVELLEDICHQVLDLYSQAPQAQALSHGHHQHPLLGQPPGPAAHVLPIEATALQTTVPMSLSAPPTPKKPSPQGSPPRAAKRPMQISPVNDEKHDSPLSKVQKVEPAIQPVPVHPASLATTDRRLSSNITLVSMDIDASATNLAESLKGPIRGGVTQAPPLPPAAAPLQLPPIQPPPPPDFSPSLTTANNFMSGDSFKSLPSAIYTESSSTYTGIPSFPPPVPIPYPPPPPTNFPPPPPPPSSFPPTSMPPPPPSIPPPPHPSYPPPVYGPARNYLPPPPPPHHLVPNTPTLGHPPPPPLPPLPCTPSHLHPPPPPVIPQGAFVLPPLPGSLHRAPMPPSPSAAPPSPGLPQVRITGMQDKRSRNWHR